MRLKFEVFWISFLIFSFSCGDKNEIIEEELEEMDVFEQGPIDFLALGDSYTIGQGVADVERWPNQLVQRLENLDFEMGETAIIAKTGWKTSNLLEAIDESEISHLNENKLVSLLIGVNNQFQQSPFETFQLEFDLLLSTSIDMAGNNSHVFVVSIPDYGVTPFGSANSTVIAQEIDHYNLYIKNKCAIADVAYIDVTEVSRELSSSDTALAPDNLHPSGFQYGVWVDTILPIVEQLLSQ